MSEVVHEALLHVDRRASARRVDVLIEDDLLMAVMDARLIVQVIINLVNNAVSYMPVEGRITVSAREERLGGRRFARAHRGRRRGSRHF